MVLSALPFTSLSHTRRSTLKTHFYSAMAVSQSGALMFAAAVVAIFALVGTAEAQEELSPTPTSATEVVAPSFAFGCGLVVASLIFGSALRI